ncbi:dTMP kinase [Tropicimonas marinistellae]|uniref:dTMP kinase n=1 Tax=Tropicimonas marinistellae TaxID=1739787 RepID=UPI00083426B0|nr:dTMP kinase [Tropicimonas marinistellae]
MTTQFPRRGVFISFEGIDGSGKSTQARLLAEALEAAGYPVVLTREPGGSTGAEEIRSLVLEGDPSRWSPETEILLFTAARRDHLEKRIWPALDAGKVVVTDRFADSTRLYQGLRGKGLRDEVDQLHDMIIRTEPDITFVIDMDPAEGLSRAKGRQTSEERFEDFGEELQRKMRAGFLDLVRTHPERCILIDGGRSVEAVALDVRDRALSRLPEPADR